MAPQIVGNPSTYVPSPAWALNRFKYLCATERLWPEMLKALHEDVLPEFRLNIRWRRYRTGTFSDLQRVFKAVGKKYAGWRISTPVEWFLTGGPGTPHRPFRRVPLSPPECKRWSQLVDSGNEQFEPLIQKLKAWAEKFHAGPDWLLDRALLTLYAWVRDDPEELEWQKTLDLHLEGSFRPDFSLASPDYWHPEYRYDPDFNPDVNSDVTETWGSFAVRMTELFQAELKRYKKQVMARYPSGRKAPMTDAEWAVLYQKGLSAMEILKSEESARDVSKTAVQNRINSFAKEIDLPLRPASR